MAGAASYNEAVPDGVVVRHLLPRIKGDPHRVQHSTGQQPKEPAEGNPEKHRLDRKKCEPAHQEVYRRGQDRKMFHKPDFEQNPRHRQSPDDREQRPTPASTQIDEQEWGVSPGDEQIYGGVIADLENSLQPPGANAVIERRGRIEADEGAAVDRATYDSPRAATHRCENDQYDEAGHAQRQANAVCQAVGKFFCGEAAAGDVGHWVSPMILRHLSVKSNKQILSSHARLSFEGYMALELDVQEIRREMQHKIFV